MTDQPTKNGVPPSPFLPGNTPEAMVPPSPAISKTARVLKRIQLVAMVACSLGFLGGLCSLALMFSLGWGEALGAVGGVLLCGSWAIFLLAKIAESLWNWLCRRNFQFTLRWLLAFTFVAALMLGGISWLLQTAAREEAKRQLRITRTAFRTVAGSLALYDAMFGHLPYPIRRAAPGRPAELGAPNGTGKPLYSWRAEVAVIAQPWCEIPWSLTEAWDSPANRRFAEIPARYCYGGAARGVGSPVPVGASTDTNLLAITGPGTAFGGEGEAPRSLAEIDSDTILAVEVVNSGLHWMEPGDFDIRTMPETINARDGRGISSRHPGGFHALFADQQTWFLSTSVPFAELRKFFTVASAKRHDRCQALGPYVLDRFPSWQDTLGDRREYYGSIAIEDPEFSDAELGQLAPGGKLTTLDLSGTQVTGSRLESLRGFNRLWSLRLDAAPVSGPGLEQLEGLPNFQALFLSDTPIDDAGLEYLRGLTRLTTLSLDGTAITDAGLTHLKGMDKLQTLNLSRTRIAGPGLANLAGMPGLTALQLSGTRVTDDSLEYLAPLKSLTSLALHRTRVTAEGVERLQQKLPNCRIQYSNPPLVAP